MRRLLSERFAPNEVVAALDGATVVAVEWIVRGADKWLVFDAWLSSFDKLNVVGCLVCAATAALPAPAELVVAIG